MSLLDPLFHSESMDQVFSDAASVQAMLQFEAALARAQANVGIIPDANARAIAMKCRVECFDLRLIAQEAAQAGNLAIPLVKKLTDAVAKDDKDASRFVHWGATSQDAVDSGVVLQLRRALELFERDLGRLSGVLFGLAEKHLGPLARPPNNPVVADPEFRVTETRRFRLAAVLLARQLQAPLGDLVPAEFLSRQRRRGRHLLDEGYERIKPRVRDGAAVADHGPIMGRAADRRARLRLTDEGKCR